MNYIKIKRGKANVYLPSNMLIVNVSDLIKLKCFITPMYKAFNWFLYKKYCCLMLIYEKIRYM